MNFIGIIPARYSSTRFPGKPLVDILGKSMIQRVYEQACKELKTVYIATDDERINKAVLSFGGNVIMTSPEHKSGTDRCAEAINTISSLLKQSFDVVVNIQGDEPFIQPEQIHILASCFKDKSTQIATLVTPFGKDSDIFNPNQTKVVINKNSEAIYFSRSPIPYLRNYEKNEWQNNFTFLKHIGLYAYNSNILREITTLTPSSLEIAESLEQNRWIENGYKIKTTLTDTESISIDTPEDLEKLIQQIK